MSSDIDVSKPLRTWPHLAGRRRRPTEYETVSTNLLWSTNEPDAPWCMSPQIPLSRWYVEHRSRSRLQHPDWDGFRDPEQMTYRTYNTVQDGQEAYVDGLLDDHDRNDHDTGLPAEWVHSLERQYTPGRYLIHAAQMSSAYLVALAPASTIANCFMFEAGDQLRWVSRIAYRTAELARNRPTFGFAQTERMRWEHDPVWQGFRELMERVLVAWDWAEQFFALNLVAKPAIDAAYLRQLGLCAREYGDTLTGLLADAQSIDSERCRRWTKALAEYALTSAESKDVVHEWAAVWGPLGDRAIEAFLAELPDAGTRIAAAKSDVRLYRGSLGITS